MRKSKSAYSKMAGGSASTEEELLPLEGAKKHWRLAVHWISGPQWTVCRARQAQAKEFKM